MGKPRRRHALVAALIMGLLAVAFALGTTRYLDAVRARKTQQYSALAGALQAAAAVQIDDDKEIRRILHKEAGSFSGDGRTTRLFFVRKGQKIPELNISKPAKLVVDLGVPGGTDENDEKLITLCARLEQHFAADKSAADLSHRVLSWDFGSLEDRIVGTFPVLVEGRFIGLAGVEMQPVTLPAPLVKQGLLALLVFVLVFGGLLMVVPGGRIAFATAAVVFIVAGGYALHQYDRHQTGRFIGARDGVTTRVVNRIVMSTPEALYHLDGLWTSVYKERASGLRIVPATDEIGSLAVSCEEGGAVLGRLAWARTVPVLLIVALALLIGLLVLPGMVALVHGLVTLPGVYAYVAPAMAGMALLVLTPFVMGVGLGFFNMDYEFIGLDNFTDILFPSAGSQTNFYFTLGFTVLWTVCNVALHVSVGLFMALVLNSKKVRFRALFRVLLIVPWAIPNYVTALIWKWMFTSQIGAINLMMEALGLTPVNWFGPSFWTNFFAVLATNSWLGFPFMMVVSLGALQSIPNELYEAADIDGASRWQKFSNVTLPLLKPALFPAIILGTIWTFNQFNIIYLVTRGQPDNKTNILITEAYRFFAELNQYGVAAAYCVLIFFILLAYTLVTNRITKATEGAFE